MTTSHNFNQHTWSFEVQYVCLFLSIGLLLEVIQKNSQGAGLLTKVGDYGTASPDGLLYLTIGIKLGQSTPGTQVLTAVNHDDGNFTLGAESTDELLVFIILAVLSKTAETGGTAVEGLSALVESLAETVVNEGLLKNLCR